MSCHRKRERESTFLVTARERGRVRVLSPRKRAREYVSCHRERERESMCLVTAKEDEKCVSCHRERERESTCLVTARESERVRFLSPRERAGEYVSCHRGRERESTCLVPAKEGERVRIVVTASERERVGLSLPVTGETVMAFLSRLKRRLLWLLPPHQRGDCHGFSLPIK